MCGRRRRRRRGGSGAGPADERLAERQVEVHRPGRPRPRAPGAASDRHVAGAAGVGDAGIVEPPHGAAVEVGLVDRLRRADVAQLGRAVGGHDEHRHVRQAGLDDGRVEVGRRRAARAQQHGRRPAEPEPEGDERRRPLVVDDVHGERPAAPSRASAIGVLREPGATTAWRDAVGDPLVDERGAERRLARQPLVVTATDDTASRQRP